MRSSSLAGIAMLLALVASAVAVGSARAADNDPWNAGATWLSVRAGYAKNSAPGAGNGGGGYGIGFSHMLGTTPIGRWQILGLKPLGWLHWSVFKDFSLGGYVHYDVLGRVGEASEIEVPATIEIVRHFRAKNSPHTYLGAGMGPFYRKTYRTGNDQVALVTGCYGTTGVNALVAPNQLLGLDLRWARVVNKNDPPNPVFGVGGGGATHWSVKLNYSFTY
jgi:outer membrane protein W